MKQFLLDELFSMTLAATVQRSQTYREKTSEKEKAAFRSDLKKSVEDLSKQYRKAVSDNVHCTNIQTLADDLSAKHGNILHKHRFRIGSAQKSLNLYLKYMWCLERAETPPHCPIDSIVLEEIRKKTGYKSTGWTRLDSISEYKEIIRNAEVAAGKFSLADWELQFYNKSPS